MSDNQIDRINNLLEELASGNFSYREESDGKSSELASIIEGINSLGEELEASTVSRDYLDNIYRGVVDMLIILQPDNTISGLNESVTTYLGYEPQELIGKHISILLTPNFKESLLKINEGLFKRGRNYSIENQFITKSGQPLPVSCSTSLLFDKKDRLKGILYVAKDISKLKRTEAELKSINKELNTFVYNASHDLKGPLASILGLAAVAEDDILQAAAENKEETALSYLKLIRESAHLLDQNLTNLIEVTYLKQSGLNQEKVDLKELIGSIATSLSHIPQYKEVRLIIEIDDTVDLLSDPKLLRSVLQNLIENAMKYRNVEESESWVKVGVTHKEKQTFIEISDNGVGIPAKHQPQIFDMFYRASIDSSGSGLGLYIVQNSVEKLGGTVSVASDTSGSTFTVALPKKK